MNRVLVVGVPRSGTTWVAEILALAAAATLVPEPDNPHANPQAARLRQTRGWHPLLRPGEPAADYARVWDLAFSGGWPAGGRSKRLARGVRRLPEPVLHHVLRALAPLAARRRQPSAVVAKSVFATFSLEWLAERYRPAVVVVCRDPLSVVASWMELGIRLGDLETSAGASETTRRLRLPPADPYRPRHERVAWAVGLLTRAQAALLNTHSDWVRLDHAALTRAPAEGFAALCRDLHVGWSNRVTERIEESNRPGSGFTTRRVRTEVGDSWRRRLDADQLAGIAAVLERFDLARPEPLNTARAQATQAIHLPDILP